MKKKKKSWWLKKAAALLMFASAVSSVDSALKTTADAQKYWISAAILVILGVLLWRGKRGPAPKACAKQRSQTPPVAPSYQFISFRVKGVTFDNKDGTSRQELLRKIDDSEPPFEDASALNVQLKPTLWNGEDAIECRVNGYQIGNVPGNLVQDVLKAMKAKDAVISGFKVIGGGYKANGEALSYGAEMSVRYSKE